MLLLIEIQFQVERLTAGFGRVEMKIFQFQEFQIKIRFIISALTGNWSGRVIDTLFWLDHQKLANH